MMGKFKKMKVQMNRIKHIKIVLAFLLSFSTYIAFYGNFLKPQYNFWSAVGEITDAQTKHIPARTYLYNKIVHEHSFPFWTEKAYSGFPIYADPENGFLNPINILSILVFGPINSYKLLHLAGYLVGSLSLFFLLKRKGIGMLGFFVANLIFYFNNFLIDHQIHYNMVLALFLLPTTILLADLFNEKRKFKYIFIESLILAYAVLWGHLQSVAIMLMAIFTFLGFVSFKKMRLATFVFFFLALFSLTAIETLPQILPTYDLLHQSSRGEGTDYLKGSLNPKMAIFAFVPYLFGENHNFFGREIGSDFSYNEIYFYCGILAVIATTISLLFVKKSRETYAAYALIWLFLLFGFMESNHLFPSFTPLVTMFREWERTAILMIFGVAFLAANFIEELERLSLKYFKKGWILVFAPIFYILLLSLTTSGKIANKVSKYISLEYISSYPYFPVIATLVINFLLVIFVFIFIKKKFPNFFPKILMPLKLIIVALMFFDIYFFSTNVVNYRLQDISYFQLAQTPSELNNKRSILRDVNILGMESLYYNNWSPFGTSQLKDSSYVDYLGKQGLNLRGVTSSIIEMPKDFSTLKYAGIVAVSQHSGISYINNDNIDLLKGNVPGSYLIKGEGNVKMQISNPQDSTIDTYLRFSPYWKVMIDGKETEIKNENIYLSFYLPKGDHIVSMQYYPWPFFIGIIISIALAIVSSALYLKFKQNINKFLS